MIGRRTIFFFGFQNFASSKEKGRFRFFQDQKVIHRPGPCPRGPCPTGLHKSHV